MVIALNDTVPKHNTHELDRSTIWQRMRQLRMRMQQRVGMLFFMFFYNVATRIYTSGVGITRDVVFVTPEGLNRMIHVLRVTYNTLVAQWKC